MKITVSLVEALPPETVICDVEWISTSGEQMRARVPVITPTEDLPKPTPIEGVAGLLEPPHLPQSIQVEAVLRARKLAEQFIAREF